MCAASVVEDPEAVHPCSVEVVWLSTDTSIIVTIAKSIRTNVVEVDRMIVAGASLRSAVKGISISLAEGVHRNA